MHLLYSRSGATAANTVKKSTSLLVIGSDPGKGKVQQAIRFKVPMWTEKEWLTFLSTIARKAII